MKMKMKRLLTALILTLLLVACGRKSPAIPQATPDELGLTWRECQVSQATYLDVYQTEACFGHPAPTWSDDDTDHAGARTDHGFRLRIGDDVYETRTSANIPWDTYALYKNGQRLVSLRGEFGAYSPDISLQNVGGKVAWEFADSHQATVIYGGEDVRHLYGLEKAYVPYGINDRLIFIGQQKGKYFVIYDGYKVGPEFDEVFIAYCCEPVLYSVWRGQGRYFFRGRRGEEYYLVEIATR